jgi:hypothetical protein
VNTSFDMSSVGEDTRNALGFKDTIRSPVRIQARVGSHAEDAIDAVGPAPDHQVLAVEVRIVAQYEPHVRLAAARRSELSRSAWSRSFPGVAPASPAFALPRCATSSSCGMPCLRRRAKSLNPKAHSQMRGVFPTTNPFAGNRLWDSLSTGFPGSGRNGGVMGPRHRQFRATPVEGRH